MTERRKFDLIRKIGDVEIRKYHQCAMATVLVNSDFERSGNIGFRPLVTYISQNRIAMTAPVIQEQNTPNSWLVSFVMPSEMQLKDMPIPKNSQVQIREVAEEYMAVLPFSGLSSWRRVHAHSEELLSVLRREGIKTIGSVQIARFDPPWKPGFMRYNEVLVPIKH